MWSFPLYPGIPYRYLTGVSILSRNPCTEETIATFDEHSDHAVEARLQRAVETFSRYRKTTSAARAAFMNETARILDDEAERIGAMLTAEMGKPINAAIAEARKCASVCRYYADNAATFLAPEPIVTEAAGSRVIYQPLGVLLAVMPWNFPFWQFFRFAAPALMAGNTVLLKHASNVPQSALELETLLRRAGFPEGVMQTLLIRSGKVAGLISDDRVAAVTLTGSTEAGRAVAVNAGYAIKKSVLELGGSDPFVVMPSADLDRALSTAVTARTINNGQSCIAAKRFVIHRDVADSFLEQFTARMKALRVGDPRDEATQIGPLATEAMRDEVADQVRDTVSAGARVLTGGRPIDRRGWFYEPTVLVDIPAGSPAHRDEIFGPVAAVFVAENSDDAIRIANDSPFGLAASVWTTDPGEEAQFIEELEVGAVMVNRMVASDPRLPFGGVKISGYGRELGPHGIREFVNIKTVVSDT